MNKLNGGDTMDWEDILKSYTREMMIDTFVELYKAVNIWAGINNHSMDDEEIFGTLAYRLNSVKEATFDNVEMDLYKAFMGILEITDEIASVEKPLKKLWHMVQWREDNT
tara:strand:+ start:238 stop:567 length:330 start_codon:yes stop_codon:yes gene_type:complete